MSKTLRRLLAILTSNERRALMFLALAVAVMAVLEIASISSVAPLVALAAGPEIAESSAVLAAIKQKFGIDDARVLLLYVGIGVLGLLILSTLVSAVTMWLGLRFAWRVNTSLSYRLLFAYLSRNYLYFVRMNSAELARNILGEVAQVTNGMIASGFNMCARMTVAILIVTLLFVANPAVAATVVGILGVCYAVIFLSLRFKLQRSSIERVETGASRYRMIGEVLNGIKDVKCFAKENYFLDRFADASDRYGRSQSNSAVIGRIPSYALELLSFGAVIGMIITFVWQQKPVEEFLPIAGLYVFAGYRLLPALQQSYAGLVSFKYNAAALELIFEGLKERESGYAADAEQEAEPAARFEEVGRSDFRPLKEALEFKNVSFTYPEAGRKALEKINLRIEPRSTIGIAGPTGSGKTTLVDVMLGLVAPDEGEVLVDGVVIDESNVRNWQQNIGYVAQSIFLYDETMARNIAFGEPDECIDHDRVREVARMAHIDEHIRTLPEGYETVVGEGGIRLSGGQRQRLGIARALYHDPEVVILDEATSALDNVTESIVMEMIGALGGKKTIVIIAHRISTIQRCDDIYVLDEGHVAGHGRYGELIEQSVLFRDLATAGNAIES